METADNHAYRDGDIVLLPEDGGPRRILHNVCVYAPMPAPGRIFCAKRKEEHAKR